MAENKEVRVEAEELDLNEVRRIRREKLNALVEAGKKRKEEVDG